MTGIPASRLFLLICVLCSACSKAESPLEFCKATEAAAKVCFAENRRRVEELGSSAEGCPVAFRGFQPVYVDSRAAAQSDEARREIDRVFARFTHTAEISSKPNTVYTTKMLCDRIPETLK
jgi:membrane-bound lytic murein transglycosylase B